MLVPHSHANIRCSSDERELSKGQVLGASLCVLIERASNGEVTRQQLRPFDWMNIWPELEDTKTLTQPLSRSLIHENQA